MTIGAVNARVAGYVEIRLSAARHTRQTVAAHSHPLRMAVDFVNGATAVIDLGHAVGTTAGVERARLTLQLRTHNLWCCCTHTRWHITFVTALALRRRQRAFAITRFVFSRTVTFAVVVAGVVGAQSGGAGGVVEQFGDGCVETRLERDARRRTRGSERSQARLECQLHALLHGGARGQVALARRWLHVQCTQLVESGCWCRQTRQQFGDRTLINW